MLPLKSISSGRLIAAGIFALLILLIGFCIGFLAGYYNPRTHTLHEHGDPAISELLLKEINPENIRNHLRTLTANPHLSGTEGDEAVTNYIYKFWRDNGLENVKMIPYKVLLSFPNMSEPNRIEIRDSSGQRVFATLPVEPAVRPEQANTRIVPPFNGYSAAGTPQGQLVYVNYGRVEDFEAVTKLINITGCICIARYGRIFRGNKARLAEQFGCSGLIIYSDPADFALSGTDKVYPDSWWLPGTGVQRGSLQLSLGDPLTPLYPATESAYRLDPARADLPKIPVQPIGYDDARVLMMNMTGQEASAEWKGRLGVPYNIGPGFVNSELSVKMTVSTYSQIAKIRNVVGFIEGSTEPDRYVILGNHHDAWVFGAVDPSSATAVMLELVRAFGKMVRQGWRPRRTIVFCAWGAEEQGLIGSREWVEHFGHILGHRGVAYLNVDLAIMGNYSFRGRALPLLKDVLYEVTKVVPNPDEDELRQGQKTLYDTWLRRAPGKNRRGELTGKPTTGLLGSGSDFDAFIGAIGVTAVDFRYSYDEDGPLSTYPLYHSAYETFHLVETYIDPTFKLSTAVGQVWAELARRLADHIILPFNVSAYAAALGEYLDAFEAHYGQLLALNRIDLDQLRRATGEFTKAAEIFQRALSTANKADPMLIRQLNDQLIQLERNFIDPPGILGRLGQRHVVFAPSQHNAYAGAAFPGLVDSLFRIELVADGREKEERWNEVRKQVSILVFFVETAAASLLRPTQF